MEIQKHFNRATTLAERAWRIYVNPPAETKIYHSPEGLPVLAKEINSIPTQEQPKQIATYQNNVFVSCMSGRKIQIFDLENNLQLKKELDFKDQVVEVKQQQDLLLATTTNFSRQTPKRNKLWLINPQTLKVISSVNTEGNWSKVPTLHPSGDFVLVSNWHSHDISIINIKDRSHPKIEQLLTPPKGRQQLESPRAIEFTTDGKTGLVTGFYSKNILEINYQPDQGFSFNYVSPSLGPKDKYAGNPRDLVILNSQQAIYSNLGLNTINLWSIPERQLIKSTKVGKEPNSISLIGSNSLLAASCRASQAIYLLQPQTLEILGRSPYTDQMPTGLCATKDGFLASDFQSQKLHQYRFNLASLQLLN